MILYAISTLSNAIATIIIRVVFVYFNILQDTIIPSVSFNSINLTVASFMLFLLHTGNNVEYSQVDDGDDNGITIDENNTFEVDQDQDQIQAKAEQE